MIEMKAGDRTCTLTRGNETIYLPVTAERLCEMFDECAATQGVRRTYVQDGVVRVEIDEHQFTVTNHPHHFSITLREYVRGLAHQQETAA